jgi:hypothetical protein
MNARKVIYTTKPTKNRPYEIFKRDPDGNTRVVGEGEEKKIGRMVYCSFEELQENIKLSNERARDDERTSKQIFRDLIFFVQQYGNNMGGIIVYEDINDRERGKPKIKRSYSKVVDIEEIMD